MFQILDSAKEEKILPLFRLAFRPLFLFGALYAALAMLIWLGVLNGWWNLGRLHPIWWHAHEMLFGFGCAIIVGFLLTAVQNWTGHSGVRGWKLAALLGLWVAARLGLPLLGSQSVWVMLADLGWLPLATLLLAMPLWRARQWRNLFFVPLLLGLTLLNGATYYALSVYDWLLTERLLLASVLLITSLIAVMGGRVIPFFTWRGTQSAKITPLPWLEGVALVSLWLLTFGWILLPSPAMQSAPVAGLYLLAGASHLLRLARWHFVRTLGHPLLWSLHLAYFFIPLGLFALAAHSLGYPPSLSLASHLLTTGAMGSMILAMIARVSLGHTGRGLQVGRAMVLALGLILLAGVLRTLGPWLWPGEGLLYYNLSGLAWILAYGLFVLTYLPILTRPRLDGRPG